MSSGTVSENHSNLEIFNSFDWLAHFNYNHPEIVKTIEVSGIIFGIIGVATAFLTAPTLGVLCSVSIVLLSSSFVVASFVALLAIDILFPPPCDNSVHSYIPNECEGGRLYYEGDIPILTLDYDNPHIAGKANGYLCGNVMNDLLRRFDLVLHTLAGEPRARDLPQTIEQIRQILPPEILEELNGIIEGYTQWADENPNESPMRLTVDDLIFFHLLPDSEHFSPSEDSSQDRVSIPSLACTSIVERDENGNLVFARNMDWPTLNIAGSSSLIINRKFHDGRQNTVELGIPGSVGTITGMNSSGLSMAMNVCSGNTRQIRGIPAIIFNRMCLQQCRDLEEFNAFLGEGTRPLGPYHLTVADPNQAESVHFDQDYGWRDDSLEMTDVIRPLPPENDCRLITLNCRYHDNGDISAPMHFHAQREEALDAFFSHRENRPLEEALALPYVNNGETAHKVLMKPGSREMFIAMDNAFAGSRELQQIPVDPLLA